MNSTGILDTNTVILLPELVDPADGYDRQYRVPEDALAKLKHVVETGAMRSTDL